MKRCAVLFGLPLLMMPLIGCDSGGAVTPQPASVQSTAAASPPRADAKGTKKGRTLPAPANPSVKPGRER